jgi:hypothetical protein
MMVVMMVVVIGEYYCSTLAEYDIYTPKAIHRNLVP